MSNRQPISTFLGIAAAALLATSASGFGVNPCPEDTNRDGVINVLDLIELLLCFGQPNLPPCTQEDINEDGNVNVLDLIDLLLAFGTACPQNPCAPNCDPFATLSEPGAETQVEFGSIDIPPIPADFFFPGSDPFVGNAQLGGFLLDPDNTGTTDTIVCRSGPINFPGAGFPRPSDPIAVEIVELSLTGLSPITVGPAPEDWVVAMGLAAIQQQGQLDAIIESPAGGITVATVPVSPKLAFARLDDLIALDAGQIPPEQVQVRILDFHDEGLPPVNMGWAAPFPFSTVPPQDGSFFCPGELENPFPFFPGVPPGGGPAHGEGKEAPGLPPHIAAGGPGHLHFVCPPPPPPPGLCTYTLLGSILFGCGGGCPAPAAGKIFLPCPVGGPPPCPPGPPPIGCPPFIAVIFPCPGGGFCVSFYVAAACCLC